MPVNDEKKNVILFSSKKKQYCSQFHIRIVIQYTISYTYNMFMEYFDVVPIFFCQLFSIHKIKITII